jgi:serine/threonine protein kinase
VTTIPPARPDSGPIVGRYRLLARIGEGGMGVVHVAEGADGRRVALKVLRPHVVGDDEGRQRLAREVSSLRQVHSPHVAEVLDADPWGMTPYIVTRYVPGHSLYETVRRDGPLPLADLAYAGRRLLDAVRDVHAAEVLHRDLKPTNVVMEGRAPILIDFGLARLAEDPRLTATGWLLGTPGYLAPEMLFGDPATAATDVHGWAATIVYAATGQSPYGGGHTMAILDRTRRGEVRLHGVPERLRPLLAGCLALEPLDRPTTREVLDELDALETSARPTQVVPVVAAPSDPDPVPDPTLPWQLVRHEEPATDVIEPVRSTPPPDPPAARVPVASPTTPYTVVQPPTNPADAPPPTSIAPTPLAQQQPARQPVPQPAQPMHRPMTTAARFRRGCMLLAAGAVVATAFRVAPYVAFFALSAVVVALRGASLTQEASWRRRTTRGPRWFDGPVALAGYPWHTLRGLAGSIALLAVVGLLAAGTAGWLVVLGVPAPDALLAAGVVAAFTAWWGPFSKRVRHVVGRSASTLARSAWTGWPAVALVTALAVVLWWAAAVDGIIWAPASGGPLTQLREQLRHLVPDRLPL